MATAIAVRTHHLVETRHGASLQPWHVWNNSSLVLIDVSTAIPLEHPISLSLQV
ncbi:hypothetical protein [Coleofasciculus chthonoplastes]|uniref:hypothetical protein n=1 Tax=Coleofasciculus chthonoplastes TaxID=64178 RepID=UPI0032FB50C5